jgi:ABC-2 type transport system ATP-binding protein
VPGESIFWPSLTGAETLHLLGKVHGQIDPKYQKELIKRFKFEANKKVRTYSKGNRQKINLIAALSTRAELLIMDEPTTGLDPIMEQAFKQSVLEAQANNQTVFLSSHILEEAEALCDRVAILRSGKLVELGTLAQMRHLSAVSIQATFEGVPPNISHIQGVSNAIVTGHQLSCQVRGSIEPLLSVLSAAHPKTLLSREPSLEELFLSIYGDGEVNQQAIG